MLLWSSRCVKPVVGLDDFLVRFCLQLPISFRADQEAQLNVDKTSKSSVLIPTVGEHRRIVQLQQHSLAAKRS